MALNSSKFPVLSPASSSRDWQDGILTHKPHISLQKNQCHRLSDSNTRTPLWRDLCVMPLGHGAIDLHSTLSNRPLQCASAPPSSLQCLSYLIWTGLDSSCQLPCIILFCLSLIAQPNVVRFPQTRIRWIAIIDANISFHTIVIRRGLNSKIASKYISQVLCLVFLL